MTTRKDLHELVDWLPEGAWNDAHQVMLECLKNHDRLRHTLYTAPEEYPTEEEIAAIEEAYAAEARGEPSISDTELKRKLGL